jgi:O-glycosyl hydrolase
VYDITRYVKIDVDPKTTFQTVDGFGVNINSKYWNGGKLAPIVDLLVEDLGACLYRLDPYGKSNWIDPKNRFDASILNQAEYDRVYSSEDFQNALGMAKHLNAKGIKPYLTLSGIVPAWMCAADGQTLARFDEFAELVASFAEWARKSGIEYELLGPLNETDLGPPEGPLVAPKDYVSVCELLIEKLDRRGLTDVKLVVAEQAKFNVDYLEEFLKNRKVMERVAAFGMHCYSDFSSREFVDRLKASGFGDVRVWMSEFGDLDQGDDKEWYIAYNSFKRLARLLEDGLNGAIAWDAYDNYHDHDAAWTRFGLVANSWGVYEPKKRYFGYRQIFRFVRPGFRRVSASSPCDEVRVLAFESPDGKDLTVVGYNDLLEDVFVNVDVAAFQKPYDESAFTAYRTSFRDDCVTDGPRRVMQRRLPFSGVEIVAPSRSIFTITTVRA